MKQQQKEDWEHQEDVDDRIIESEDFDTEVTMFKGKPYPTINAYFAIATDLEIDIDEQEEKETDTDWIIKVRATWTKPGSDKELHRWGSQTEKKNDRYGYAKAWSKAQRNAFKGFLRGHPQMKKAIEQFMKGEAKPQPKNQPQPPENEPRNEIREAIEKTLEAYKRRYEQILNEGIDVKNLWDSVKYHYNVESRDDMKVIQWREVEILFNTAQFDTFKQWIKEMENPI